MNYETRCKACGHPHPFTKEGGPLLLLRNDSLFPLFYFMCGKFDHPQCEVCDEPFTFTQTVALVFDQTGSILIATGDLLKSAPKSKSTLLDDIEKSAKEFAPDNDWTIKTFDSLPELRKAVVIEFAGYIPIVDEIRTIKDTPSMHQYLEQHWREIKPDVIVASFLILAARGGGPDIINLLADLQAWTWIFLCAYWSDPSSTGLFSDDIDKFVVASPIIPQMAERFDSIADVALKSPSGQLRFKYCVEAIRAHIHKILGNENPYGTRWAQLFVKLEMEARRSASPDSDLDRLRLSPKRVSWSTTYHQLHDAIGLSIRFGNIDDLEIAQQLAVELEYPDLIGDVLGAFVVTNEHGEEILDAASLLDEMLENTPASYKTEDAPTGALEAIVTSYPHHLSVDDLVALCEVTRKHFPPMRLCSLRIDVWLAEKFNAQRQPRLTLELLRPGSFVAGEKLPVGVATGLFTEIGTAFRLIGLPNRALLAYSKVVEILEDARKKRGDDRESSDLRTAKRNLAIANRECGAPDVALSIFLQLWDDAFGHDDVPLLESLAATYLAVGNNEQALKCINSALDRAVGPLEHNAERLRSIRAMIRSTDKDKTELVDELLATHLPNHDDLATLAPQACAWINILASSDSALFLDSEPVEERVTDIANLLLDFDEVCRDKSDVQSSIIVLTLLGCLCEILEDPQADGTWNELHHISHEAGQGDNAYALFALARMAYESGDIAEGRSWLELVPQAFVASIGLVQRLHIAARALSWHSYAFSRVARVINRQPKASHEDFRLIAEISRDTIRRAINAEDAEESRQILAHKKTSFVAPYDEALMRLAPGNGMLGVLEWVDFGSSTGALITAIHADGNVESRWLDVSNLNLFELTKRIRAKLDFWSSMTPGDPFDSADWRLFEAWLSQQVGKILPDDQHLIIIDSANFAGLPWHVAASAHWSCSYASGWQSLFDIVESSKRAETESVCIGIARVFTYDESEDLVNVLHQSCRRTETFALDAGYRLERTYDTDCDHERFSDLLRNTTHLKVLCHGYVSRQEDEVAFMIATQQSLPLKLPQAAETEIGRAHRYSWRNIAALDRSSGIVFSAACSTLSTHIVGQGERLGIFASLRERGTRAFVAPAWDVEPRFTSGILDSVMEAYLTDGGQLGQILRRECSRASREVPRWLAWSISIEGDWR